MNKAIDIPQIIDALPSFDLISLETLNAEIGRQINKAREQERKAVKAQILELAKKAGMSLDELLSEAKKSASKGGGRADKTNAKYRHPSNSALTWTGRGRKPIWLQELLNGGAKLDELRIQP